MAVCTMFVMFCAYAQDDFRQKYEEFKRQAQSRYLSFRDEANRQYAEFVRRAWSEARFLPGTPRPEEKDRPPVVIRDEERAAPVEENVLPVRDTVELPRPEPQPHPVAPIEEQPQVKTLYKCVSATTWPSPCQIVPSNLWLTHGSCFLSRNIIIWSATACSCAPPDTSTIGHI